MSKLNNSYNPLEDERNQLLEAIGKKVKNLHQTAIEMHEEMSDQDSTIETVGSRVINTNDKVISRTNRVKKLLLQSDRCAHITIIILSICILVLIGLIILEQIGII
jgi:t-SNARE complex subunit (syntaxin)